MKPEIIRIDLDNVNCYLGKENGNFILFDTGGHLLLDKVYSDRRAALLNGLERAGCQRGNLKLILLTHGDIDHVANAQFLKEEYQTKIAIHTGDLELVEKPTIETMLRSSNYKSIMLKIVFQIIKKLIIKLSNRILSDLKPFKPDILVNDGDSLSEYGFSAKVLHLPGHTAGSIGVLTENGDLIAGDTFMNLKKPGIAPNAVDFKTMANSIARLKTMNLNTVYPGHGKPFRMSEL